MRVPRAVTESDVRDRNLTDGIGILILRMLSTLLGPALAVGFDSHQGQLCRTIRPHASVDGTLSLLRSPRDSSDVPDQASQGSAPHWLRKHERRSILTEDEAQADSTTGAPAPRIGRRTQALDMFGRVFGGATAYPKAKGVWRDDERGGALVRDEPVVVHCYTTPEDVQNSENLAELGGFCKQMGRDAGQGEVGLVVGDEYFAIRQFERRSRT